MAWWIWIIVGLALLVIELFIPSGFFICLVGIGAILTGLLVLVGLGGPLWLHWFLCAAISGALVFFVRRQMLGGQSVEKRNAGVVPSGEEVIISSPIVPGGTGEGQLRGAVWMIRNVGASELQVGDRCLVESVEGITLMVRSRVTS